MAGRHARLPAHAQQTRVQVGDRIQISLNSQIFDAVIRAVLEHTEGVRLQVDFGNEQTALIYDWQVVKE